MLNDIFTLENIWQFLKISNKILPHAPTPSSIFLNIHLKGRSQEGGGIGGGHHFLLYKFIERTIEHWANFTKQLLITSRGHQVPRKAAHCLQKESSNTPLLFLNFHFHFTITLQKKTLFLEQTSYIFLKFFVFLLWRS